MTLGIFARDCGNGTGETIIWTVTLGAQLDHWPGIPGLAFMGFTFRRDFWLSIMVTLIELKVSEYFLEKFNIFLEFI